jgi:cytidylate kinase
MPFDSRVNNVAKEFGVYEEEAKRRVINRENRRSAFIRQSFNADLADPLNYDMVINMQKLIQHAALVAVIGMVIGGKDIDTKLPVMKATTT